MEIHHAIGSLMNRIGPPAFCLHLANQSTEEKNKQNIKAILHTYASKKRHSCEWNEKEEFDIHYFTTIV